MTSTEILIVDDDQSLLECMLRSIQTISSSLTVLPARNGLQALTLLKEHCVRLIVSDLKMPVMDGFELLAHVMENYPDIPVILTTGQSIPNEKRDVIKQSALDVLLKPFALKKLCDRVKGLLDKQADGGTLNNVSPAMFLQLIHMEQKTCTVRVNGQSSGQLGVLFFRDGKLLNARMNNLQGEPATLEIFSWDHISLSIQNDCPVNDLKINRTLNGLILEASRISDERSDAGMHKVNPDTLEDSKRSESVGAFDGKKRLAALRQRLKTEPDLNCHVKALSLDEKWQDLISEIMQIGQLFNAGELKAMGLCTHENGDYIIYPATQPIVLNVDSKCIKEKFYSLLE